MASFQHSKLSLVMQNMDTQYGNYFNSLHRDDRLFLQGRIEIFPTAIQRLLISRYKSHSDRVKANIELRETCDKLNELLPPMLFNHFNASEDEFRDLAQEFADLCRDKVKPYLAAFLKSQRENSEVQKGISEDNTEISESESLVFTGHGQKFSELGSDAPNGVNERKRSIPEKFPEISENHPETKIGSRQHQIKAGLEFQHQTTVNATVRNNTNQAETAQSENSVNASLRNEAQLLAYKKCADFVNGLGLTAPTPDKSKTLTGCIKRMKDKRWWLRTLRKIMVRKTEECMLHLNKVHKHAGIYCSDITASNRKYQKARQLKMLESISLVNEHDQRYSLREIYDLNISNPINRRNELMTRMRGFEDIAKELGHIGDFITLTCPSKYHAAYAKSGDRNPNWQGFTPQQGQQYLCGIWAKIRAELDRQEMRTYGLRVAEPQHDGTPHWHMMLFVQPEHLTAFRAVISHYAFQEDGDEAGAKENRIKFVAIDPSKGSATGYVAKYICKNIDGANIDEGVYGENPIEAAERVEAWASCWGIRQFQQIGGVSVTVWRELRRMRKLEQQDITLTAIHQAADSSNWQSFVTLMGGVFCKRKEQTIRPHYDIEIDTETGQITTDYYDGFITTKLKGICYLGQAIITRLHQWRLEISQSAFRSHLEFCK
jgi:hypothetical protein